MIIKNLVREHRLREELHVFREVRLVIAHRTGIVDDEQNIDRAVERHFFAAGILHPFVFHELHRNFLRRLFRATVTDRQRKQRDCERS